MVTEHDCFPSHWAARYALASRITQSPVPAHAPPTGYWHTVLNSGGSAHVPPPPGVPGGARVCWHGVAWGLSLHVPVTLPRGVVHTLLPPPPPPMTFTPGLHCWYGSYTSQTAVMI